MLTEIFQPDLTLIALQVLSYFENLPHRAGLSVTPIPFAGESLYEQSELLLRSFGAITKGLRQWVRSHSSGWSAAVIAAVISCRCC